MNVSPNEPFQLIYSIFAHEYLGYLFESFVVKKDAKGVLTLTYQNISSKNAEEFNNGLDEKDFEIIRLMDSIQQDSITHKFSTKHLKPEEFLPKVFNKEKGDTALQEVIAEYVDRVKTKILPLLHDKHVYIMGNDGDPVGKRVEVPQDKATILFHFRKNEDNTHYFPTIKYRGEKIDFQYNGSQIISKNPAWLLVKEEQLISFEKGVDGSKLKPFLNKRFIVIPKSVEEKYYKTFITQLVANFDVYAKGFIINSEAYHPVPVLSFRELSEATSSMSLFENKNNGQANIPKIVFDLSFQYGEYLFSSAGEATNSVTLENKDGEYIFHKVKRKKDDEKSFVRLLKERNVSIKNGKAVLDKAEAFDWLNNNREDLVENFNFKIEQAKTTTGKKYFIGRSSINIEIKENNDWFDIHAEVHFGDYKIPFLSLRKLILKGKTEFELPNGEIAVIPPEWLTQYSDLFNFSEHHHEDEHAHLKKHHLALVQALEEGNLAQVSMDRKLQRLREFDHLDDYELPSKFIGELRPYQKAGYNWMRFLQSYNFGGCLADDMGLGKTIQTLCMLQHQKEMGSGTSLLVMPTSLVYNWEQEATKFTPDLNVLVYTGTYRDKNVERFSDYDIVITSYGITRIDVDLLKDFYFNYIILDESQAIKNPSSNIATAVKKLNSKHKLILTGTPIENSTLDLWSQMSFVNPGLLGSQSFFKNFYLNAIEKKNDVDVKRKLYALIKPFILRRNKAQVLTELPPKIEQVWYSSMTEEQEKEYEEVKSHYRNVILKEIDEKGMNKSQITILQGLTKLRQIANHPRMVDPEFIGDSGKLLDVVEMLETTIESDHKILIFSQFVKHLAVFKDLFKKKGIDFAYLDGTTKARQEQVELFQNNEGIKIFLISLKAGGLGLNLTAADYVYILDPWWNPAIESQAVDRAYRMGQKNTVHTYKFITRNTVEEKILKLQLRKKQLAGDLITTEESFVKNLTKEDIQEILS